MHIIGLTTTLNNDAKVSTALSAVSTPDPSPALSAKALDAALLAGFPHPVAIQSPTAFGSKFLPAR
jgi:hypothetical protein